jgi:hypothetical protein
MKVVKKATVKKSRIEQIRKLVDPKESTRITRKAENALIDFEEVVATRYAFASEIMENQDSKTIDAIERLVEKMGEMAGPPVFMYEGLSFGEKERLEKIQLRNLYWVAVRLMAACATWDIKIANFTLPTDRCAKCRKA